jgi:hypothetical protein
VLHRKRAFYGRWVAAYLDDMSTPGSSILVHDIGECDDQVAYHLVNGELQPIAPSAQGGALNSRVLGWYGDFAAYVQLQEGRCNQGNDRPGIYSYEPNGELTLVLETTGSARFWVG